MVKPFEDRSDKSKPTGEAKEYLYGDYYWGTFTIANAVAADPGWADAPVAGTANTPAYDQHDIYVTKERKADKLWVCNDAAAGGATLFVRVAFSSQANFSAEFPIYPQQFVVFLNVYSLRARSAAIINYRVSEFELGAL